METRFRTFEKQLVTTKTVGSFRTDLLDRSSFVKKSLRLRLGGVITGCCFKGGMLLDTKSSVEDFIACPDCLENRVEAKLRMRNGDFLCSNCGTSYPSIDGVAFVFPHAILSALYPDIYIVSCAQTNDLTRSDFSDSKTKLLLHTDLVFPRA